MKEERFREILEDACAMQRAVEKDVMLQKVYGKWYFSRIICELKEKLEYLETAERLFGK